MSNYYTFGAVTTGDTTNNFLALSNDLSTQEFSGFFITDYCFRPVNKYQILYYDYNWQGWAPARCDSLNTMPAKGIALESTYATYYIRILLYGGLYNPNWNFDINKYKRVWASPRTAGNIALSYLNRRNLYNQPIGLVISPKQIFFHFQQLWFHNIDDGFS